MGEAELFCAATSSLEWWLKVLQLSTIPYAKASFRGELKSQNSPANLYKYLWGSSVAHSGNVDKVFYTYFESTQLG